MSNPAPTPYLKLLHCSVLRILFSFIGLLMIPLISWSQQDQNPGTDTTMFKTIPVKKGTWFYYNGKMYKVKKDTVFIIESTEIPESVLKNERQSNTFYDSVYKKLSRTKFSQMLYNLAFKPSDIPVIPGHTGKIKSHIPFEQYKGKVIRQIRIKTLDPFGTSINDTLSDAQTGVGKALNSAHLTTHAFVIRKNLFIKEGQKVDPYLLADNERNIREMSFIDNVKTLVSFSDSTKDSVDIMIITKDVWSIGFDVITLETNRSTFRVYDGNFVGLGDRLTANFSYKTTREPFLRVDGASYSYNNIGGTFLNTLLSYSMDDPGNQTMAVSLNRNFYSINTKWAFGTGYQYSKMVQEASSGTAGTEAPGIISYYNDINLWGGRAFKVNNTSIPTRFTITEAFFRRNYFSRPGTSIDSNRAYYNTTRFLTGFAYTANSSYLSDYILQFGKTENIPYGKSLKVTLGPEKNDFYTRMYGSIDLSSGDFISNWGYFSGRTVLGGYLNKNSGEDCVLKTSLRYLTPLWALADKRFRFRGYFSGDYMYGFNFRKNNTDYSNINNALQIDKVVYDTVFHGSKSLSATLFLVMYSPLYFYGFRFAFMMQAKGGYVAQPGENLFHQPLYTGFGVGVLIHNDNLIFPTFVISLAYYPMIPHGTPWWQFRFDQNLGVTLPDFNVSMPQTETLQN
jgi:hypothetical protein